MQSPPPPVPPARFFWTKELDLRLVQAIQTHLGADIVKHHRKDGSLVCFRKLRIGLEKALG